MKRIYEALIVDHFSKYNQVVILNGPRQVGKTTISMDVGARVENFVYLNWDIKEDRNQILQGQRTLAQKIKLNTLQKNNVIVFDELHKYSGWKSFLKGFYDAFKNDCHIIVTGSQKLSIRQKAGDSLMGRYFPFRIHPLSVAECIRQTLPNKLINPPARIKKTIFQDLYNFGGYPDPFLKKDKRFLTRWQNLREEQLFYEDIRDLSHIQEISQLEILAHVLKNQPGQLVNYSNLANKVNVTAVTIQKWINTLERFHFCFLVRPWSKNVSRSLLKEPKMYLWDWSKVQDVGSRNENFIACHLLKAVQFWTDFGFGKYDLYFLRTKDKKEVDFVVTENDKPWFLVEVKSSSNHSISKNLYWFYEQTEASHAFQVAFDLDYIDHDCFKEKRPVIVPVSTLLSQFI